MLELLEVLRGEEHGAAVAAQRVDDLPQAPPLLGVVLTLLGVVPTLLGVVPPLAGAVPPVVGVVTALLAAAAWIAACANGD